MSGKGRDEFHRLRTAYLKLRTALRDPTSGLYSFTLHFDQIRSMVSDNDRIGVLWIGLGDRKLVESVYGWEAYDQLVRAVARELEDTVGELLPAGTLISVASVYADAFTLFIPCDRDQQPLDGLALARLASEVRDSLDEHLDRHAHNGPYIAGGVRCGAALLTDNPFHRFERRVHQALDEARDLAERPRESEPIVWLSELQRLLNDKQLHCLFQPIVDLESGRTMALEAYARGPEGSPLRLPRVMFSLGRDAGLAGMLDRACRHEAIRELVGVPSGLLVFLNTAAENLVDPDWRSSELHAALERAGLDPSQVVLEVSEEQMTGEPTTYRERLAPLRAAGYRLSLDDVGSGPRSVLLAETLAPEFIKFDVTMVRGAGQQALLRELVRSLSRLARRAGATLIAERVETREELETLKRCGARWGQGYLLGAERPLAALVERPIGGETPSP
ncbi:MAG: GGDEF domain-containing protein [Acidobacteriota bacterium]|nr:MAG: GGDEF domain-containing protein [Acidobacteriota bacterium]